MRQASKPSITCFSRAGCRSRPEETSQPGGRDRQTVRSRRTSRTTATVFAFMTLQSRYAAFVDLWDRGLRSPREGRVRSSTSATEKPAEATKEAERPHPARRGVQEPGAGRGQAARSLASSLVEARRSIGEDALPFHKFADLGEEPGQETAAKAGALKWRFGVAVKDGKVNFTARAMKGTKE